MEQAHRLAAADAALLVATAHRQVDLDDSAQVADAIGWWESLTEAGGEGMVVKPLDFITRGGRGLLQPAIKCRGREYLRIIYGPDYDRPENLERLKKRGLGQKRSMALREFALGLEALDRFVDHAPLTRVHQCVFGVLAMESEPVDPRL
jgi:protein phosphatase